MTLTMMMRPTLVFVCMVIVVVLSPCPFGQPGALTALAARTARDGTRNVLMSSPPRPDHSDYAKMARWLVHMNLWGVIGTNRHSPSGESNTAAAAVAPFTNVVDLSDGPMCHSSGRLLFYLTSLDETAKDASFDPNVSFTVAEAAIVRESSSSSNGGQQVIGCGTTDDEDPTCAKLTITGKLLPVPKKEANHVINMIAERHPAIKTWPANHDFVPYELHIESLGLLDFYGGMHQVDVQSYFDVNLSC